jgi:23S rRNA (guanosine2251-2'-O)-methyltransferase
MALAGIGDRVEGVHAAAACLAAGRATRLIVERRRRGDLEPLVSAAKAAGIPVDEVDDVRPLAATTAPQGVVVEARPIPPASLDDLVGLTDPAAVLVLDHLEDPRNVGAMARSARAAGVPGMVVASRRAAPLGATAFKAAAGALEHVRVAEVSSIPEALRRLSKAGLWVVGLDSDAGRALWDLDLLTAPVALVLGGEGAGLGKLAAQRCDLLVRIPMAGGTESLNTSVAAAVAMFEMARLRAGAAEVGELR